MLTLFLSVILVIVAAVVFVSFILVVIESYAFYDYAHAL